MDALFLERRLCVSLLYHLVFPSTYVPSLVLYSARRIALYLFPPGLFDITPYKSAVGRLVGLVRAKRPDSVTKDGVLVPSGWPRGAVGKHVPTGDKMFILSTGPRG